MISMNIQLILRERLYDNPHDILHKVMTIVIKFLQRQYLLVTLLFSRIIRVGAVTVTLLLLPAIKENRY